MSFNRDLTIVANALSGFYSESLGRKKPVINQAPLGEVVSGLDLEKHIREGGLTGNVLEGFLREFFTYSTRLHHPHYMGHQVAAPHYSAALGSLINGFANNVSSIYEMSPVSVSIEFVLVNWMLEKVGWKKVPLPSAHIGPDQDFGGGVLLDGGSLANLTALLLARSHALPDVWEAGNPGNLALMVPSESHYSLAKAAGIIGMGARAVYRIPTDERGAIIPDKIPGVHQRILDEGKLPIALVANACSTAVGIYDPLDEIGDYSQAYRLWYHIDGAHGAGALLSEKHKVRMKGVEKADSLIWDAHKLLQTPSLCAALLVRNHSHLDLGIKTNQEASYLFHEKEQPGVDFIHRTIETTKPAMGNTLFFVLAALGETGVAGFIDAQCQLALDAYAYIQSQEGFECPVRPESNILCFRVEGNDRLQLRIRNRLTAEGNFYITTTSFGDKRYLRLVFMSPATTLETVKELLTAISDLRETLIQQQGVTIRNATPREYQAIGQLMVQVYSGLEGFPKPDEQPEYYRLLADVGNLTQRPETELLAAIAPDGSVGGAVVYFGDMHYYGAGGTATFEKNACGFRLLAVDPAFRGKGIGKQLSLECIEKARKSQRTQLIIHTTEAMQTAWKMYEKLGFKRSADLDFKQGGLQVFGFRMPV